MSGATLLLGLGRETAAWLDRLAVEAPGRRIVVLDERPVDLDTDERRSRWAALEVLVAPPVDLDDAADVAGAVDAVLEAAGGAAVDAVVRSPGVSPYRPGVAALAVRARVTTTTGDWLARHRPSDVVAVTGTKGKSTTAALVHHLLTAAGRSSTLAGNIGAPVVAVDAAAPRDDLVLELSSYQLADLPAPEPFAVGVVTTLFVDHVPWHGSVERYHRDKLRLLDLARWRVVSPQVAASAATGGRFDAVAPAPTPAVAEAMAAAGMRGAHEAQAAMLALAAVLARVPDADVDALVASLAAFAPLPHRLRPVGTVEGRRYVDDSIATVPEAALAGLATWRPHGPVTLIVGGVDRGQDPAGLVAALADPDVRMVLLPPFGARLAAALPAELAGRAALVDRLEDAVPAAHRATPPGGTVLLSPAAPSFGAFRDFVERGERFAALVAELARDRGVTVGPA